MAWVEWRKRKDGTEVARIRDRKGKQKVSVVKERETKKNKIKTLLRTYEVKKDEAPGLDNRSPADVFQEFLNDASRVPKTILLYKKAYEVFSTFTDEKYILPALLQGDLTKDRVDRWRVAMETGALRYTRNKGKTWWRYDPTTIGIYLKIIKRILKFAGQLGYVSHRLSESIKVSKVASPRRFVIKAEVGRLIKAARVESYEQKGGGRRLPPELESRIVAHSMAHPRDGKRKVSRLLTEQGHRVSAQGVRSVWSRFGIAHVETRVRHSRQKAYPVETKAAPKLVHNHLANNRLRRVLLFGFYTGMRLGEVLRARWSNLTIMRVMLRNKDGTLSEGLTYTLFIPHAKKNKQRTVVFGPKLARILGAQKHLGETGRIFDQWTVSGLTQARNRAVERAGLDRVRFHDLRHSFIRNYLLSNAGSLAQVRVLTGHENLASLDPYAHFATADIAQTISQYKIQ
jgi:integrase